MTQGIVKHIGSQAIDAKDKMLILFGRDATEELKRVSIIQDLNTAAQPIELKEGGKISFDKQEYTITHVGRLAINHLNSIGHVTIVFKDAPTEDSLVNAIYVTPFDIPHLTEGTIITYH